MTPNNVCRKCGDDLEGCKCGQEQSTITGGLSAAKQHLDQLTQHQNGSTERAHGTASATTMSDLQQQLDELKRNIDREVTRRVKNTLHSNADLKIEVRNLRAELIDLRASNKAAIGERDKLHIELVEVRSALADVSAERDSLRTTLATWEAADTAPFVKVPDVADHVMPPVLPVPAAELPMCTTCHGCGGLLDQAYQGSDLDWRECGNMNCDRGMTAGPVEICHPYYERCKSDHPVRHE